MAEKSEERRSREERRSGMDRRKLNPQRYTGIEKRFTPDCRGSQDRREEGSTWTEHQSPEIKK
ncbi:MAG TPA: hypothetical protein DHV36_25625 [Desulfobacteraceae bacterium]|nr:hypothetical protein [Desulfobacteraceae bacterium]